MALDYLDRRDASRELVFKDYHLILEQFRKDPGNIDSLIEKIGGYEPYNLNMTMYPEYFDGRQMSENPPEFLKRPHKAVYIANKNYKAYPDSEPYEDSSCDITIALFQDEDHEYALLVDWNDEHSGGGDFYEKGDGK